MITKNDCYILLLDLKDSGIDVEEQVNILSKSDSAPIEVVTFINSKRQLDLCNFYEKLRKNYNNKKSPLYKNIVKEIEEPQEVLTTLSAMLTQALLFSKSTSDRTMFLKHARCSEISRVLGNYFETYDITNCIRLLRLIKADLKVLEGSKVQNS